MKGWRFSLRIKLISALVALAALLGVLVTVNAKVVQRVQGRFEDLTTLNVRFVRAAYELQALVYHMARAEKEFMHGGTIEAFARFEARRSKVEEAIRDLEGLIRTVQGRSSLRDLKQAYERHGDLVRQEQELSRQGRKTEVRKLSYGSIWKEINLMIRLLRGMETEYVATTAIVKKESEEFISGVRWGMRVLMGVAAILLMGIALVLLQVERGLRHVTQGMERVARRQFDVEVAENRQDELGEIQKIFNAMVRQIGSLTKRLEEEAITDILTGLKNRRAFQESMGEEIHRAKRYRHALTVAMLDLDGFKQFNDTRGHVEGDRVLRIVGRILSEAVREVDEVARYGGEEFVIIFPETGLSEARGILERIRRDIEYSFRGEHPTLTISAGLAGFPEEVSAPEQLVEAADKALYQAKRLGKNRIEGCKVALG